MFDSVVGLEFDLCGGCYVRRVSKEREEFAILFPSDTEKQWRGLERVSIG